MRMGWLGLAMLVAGLSVQPAAADSLGVVAAVQPQATGGIGNTRVTLIRGAELSEGETVITGASGEVQVVFSDQTHLVIGRGSSLVIERYLMRNDGTPQKFAVNALAGSFRFITGKGEKSAYSIATPTGTMGVRGTEFDFTVDRATGLTNVILFEGGLKLCPEVGQCVVLDQECEVGQLHSGHEAKLLHKEAERKKVASTKFPYVASQSRLLKEFRVDHPSRCAGSVEEVQPTEVVVAVVPPPPPPPPPPEPEPQIEEEHSNNGLGNGGEGSEGPDETGNPGHNGKANGKNK